METSLHENIVKVEGEEYFVIVKDQTCFGRIQSAQKKQKGELRKCKNEHFKAKQDRSQQIRWSRKEDDMYIKFMVENRHLFESEVLRRAGRVFMKLSNQMKGLRSPNQCKSHHQKMQKVTKTGSVNEIISYLQSKYMVNVYQDVKTGYSDTLDEKGDQLVQNLENLRVGLALNGKKTSINIQINLLEIQPW